MTITEMCAVMLAYENGAKIEIREIEPEPHSEYVWRKIEKPLWNWASCEYRVAEKKSPSEKMK